MLTRRFKCEYKNLYFFLRKYDTKIFLVFIICDPNYNTSIIVNGSKSRGYVPKNRAYLCYFKNFNYFMREFIFVK